MHVGHEKTIVCLFVSISEPHLSSRSREEFYPDSAAELLMGSSQHVIDGGNCLIFQPLKVRCFLGCWMRIERQWHADW